MITKLTSIASLYGSQGKAVQPGEKVLPSIPSLATGKIALATVVEGMGQNTFMLETADARFTVQSNLSLVKGEQIQFQVLSTNPVLELQKVDLGLPAQIRQNLSLAGDAINVKPLLHNLQTTFFAAVKDFPAIPVVSLNTLGQATAPPVAPQVASQVAQQIVSQLALQTTSQTAPQAAQSILQKMDAGAVELLIRQGNYTVQATILGTQGENTKLIRIGGETYPLHGPLAAKPGESKVLQLQSLQPTLNFLPVGEGGVVNKEAQPLVLNAQDQALPALVRALQLPLFTGVDLLRPPQQQLLLNLQNINPADLQEPGAGELLKRNLAQLGLSSEALVARGRGREAATQLKSVLAEIIKIFRGQEEISSSASRVLTTLENSQFLQANIQNENSILFPLPFSFLEKGYLTVDQDGGQPGEGKEAEDDISCTMHLSLEGLGDIRIRCVQGKNATRIAFFLDSQEKADFVSTFGDKLTESISSAPLLSLSFASGAGSPGTALLQKLLPNEEPLFSTSA